MIRTLTTGINLTLTFKFKVYVSSKTGSYCITAMTIIFSCRGRSQITSTKKNLSVGVHVARHILKEEKVDV